ncbi:hypothetical protein ACVWYH_005500 [Bradyrhizobium sp. GM24.11]
MAFDVQGEPERVLACRIRSNRLPPAARPSEAADGSLTAASRSSSDRGSITTPSIAHLANIRSSATQIVTSI